MYPKLTTTLIALLVICVIHALCDEAGCTKTVWKTHVRRYFITQTATSTRTLFVKRDLPTDGATTLIPTPTPPPTATNLTKRRSNKPKYAVPCQVDPLTGTCKCVTITMNTTITRTLSATATPMQTIYQPAAVGPVTSTPIVDPITPTPPSSVDTRPAFATIGYPIAKDCTTLANIGTLYFLSNVSKIDVTEDWSTPIVAATYYIMYQKTNGTTLIKSYAITGSINGQPFLNMTGKDFCEDYSMECNPTTYYIGTEILSLKMYRPIGALLVGDTLVQKTMYYAADGIVVACISLTTRFS